MAIDLETGSKESYLRKGNPFDPQNKIVAVCYKGTINKTIYLDDDPQLTILPDYEIVCGYIPNQTRVLVGHNIKFDLLYLWRSERLQYMLKEGLKIYDTQLGEYILTGQRHKYPALREIAVNKYSCKEREKKMEKYWEQGIDTSEIPRELVLEDVRNDVLDTEQVMLQQIKQLKEQGMWKLAQSMMDSILASTEMEFNGLFINQQVFQTNKSKILSRIDSLKQELTNLSERYWK